MDKLHFNPRKIWKLACEADIKRLEDLYYYFSRVVNNIVFYFEKTKQDNNAASELMKYRGLVKEWRNLHNKTERYKIPAADFEDNEKFNKIIYDVGYPEGWGVYGFEELVKYIAISDEDHDAVLAGGLDHWWIELTDDGIAKGELLYSLFCFELERYCVILGERLINMGALKDEDLKIEGLSWVDLSKVSTKTENPKESSDKDVTEEEPNLLAPKIRLQQLLKQLWFTETRSNEKYDSEWTDAFVEALMGSEYGEEIARDWAWNIDKERNRHIEIKGYVLGLLKDAGVLKETKRKIAKKIVEEQNEGLTEDVFKKKIGNLSRNMYSDTAGKQPYADWVKKYVKEH